MDNCNPKIIEYYIDEAGDTTFYNNRGKIVIGDNGCSKYFIMGMAEVEEPAQVTKEISNLRDELLANPYFNSIPSFQKDRRKTYYGFHAKDDIPEIRYKMFELILSLKIKYNAVIWCKKYALSLVDNQKIINPDYRYKEHQLYNSMVARLLGSKLKNTCEHRIVIASRSNKSKTAELEKLINDKWSSQNSSDINNKQPLPNFVIVHCHAIDNRCLQLVDYMNWTIQRLFEKQEDRFIKTVWDKIENIVYYDTSSPKGTITFGGSSILDSKILKVIKDDGT